MMATPPFMGNNAPNMLYQPRRRNNNPTLFYTIIAIAIYSSIVYVFQITPSTLLESRFFMLLVIFTILFILTADFRAFSSSQQRNNNQFPHNGHYARYFQTCSPSSSYVTKYEQVATQKCITNYPNRQDPPSVEANDEPVTEMVAQYDDTKEQGEIMKYSNNNKRRALSEVDNNRIKALSCEEKHFAPTTIYGRGKYCDVGKVERVVIKDDGTKKKKMMMKNGTKKIEEENEFANMTNEDLNRRVEEFIQKFNRQIRLQAIAKNIHCQV